MKTKYPSVFNKTEVRNELDRLHDQYILVPADKASNNIVFVFKAHYINCIFKELGFDSTHGNPTYTHSSLSKQEIIQNHKSVMDIFNIPNKQNEFDLAYFTPASKERAIMFYPCVCVSVFLSITKKFATFFSATIHRRCWKF